MTIGRAILACSHLCVLVVNFNAHAHPGEHLEIERLSKQIANEGPRLPLLIKRGRLHRIAGHAQAAIDDLTQAFALSADQPDTWLQLGLAKFDAGDINGSELLLSRYLNQHQHAEAWRARGQIRMQRHEYVRAAEDFRKADETRADPELALLQGRALTAAGSHEAAAATLRAGLHKYAGAVAIRLALIEAECRIEAFDRALELVDEAMGRARAKTRWLLRKAKILTASGATPQIAAVYERAQREAARMLTLRPTLINRLTAIEVDFMSGQKDVALRKLHEILRNHPNCAAAVDLAEKFQELTGGEPIPTDKQK